MPQINFDASQVDPSVPFETLPSGKYLVEITKSEVKPTKAGDGSYLELEYTVQDDEFKGRKVWDRLCLNHSNTKTVQIARANLSAICHAVGVLQLKDSSQLHHIALIINVKTRKDQSTDDIYNEIKGYAKRESTVPPVQATQYPQAPVDKTVPPWGRGQTK